MSHANILKLLGSVCVVLAVSMMFPLLFALAEGEDRQVTAFTTAIALSGFFGGGLVLAFRGSRRRSSGREAILVMLLVWVIAPFFAALPLLVDGTFHHLNEAVFEATSGLTTTGATLLENLREQPRSILIWRSILQWMGGFATIVMAVAIFSATRFGDLPVHRLPIKISDDLPLSDRLLFVVKSLITTYLVITLLCFIVLWASGLPRFDAFCIALSTLSTGGFMTIDGSFSDYGSALSEIVLLIFMVMGALNFVLHTEALQGRFRFYKQEPEVIAFCVLILSLGILFFALSNGEGNSSRTFFSSFFNVASLMSTTGYGIGEGQPMANIPPVLILTVALVGGSALSTAGGLKLVRGILLIRQGVAELERLAHPHSVVRIRYGAKTVNPEIFNGLWIYFVVLTLALAGFSLALAGLGYDFLTSISAAAATLSNAGPIFEYATADALPFNEMSEAARWILSLSMIIGRVEILLILPIFDRLFWEG